MGKICLFLLCMLAVATTVEAQPKMMDLEISKSSIIINVVDTPLSFLLGEISSRTSVPITGAGLSDVSVSASGTFPSIEALLRRLCENLAIVYTKMEDGSFRVIQVYAESTGKNEKVLKFSDSAKAGGASSPKSHPELSTVTEKSPADTTEKNIKPRRDRPSFRMDQLLIQFTPNGNPREIIKLHSAMGCRLLRILPGSAIHQVELPKGADIDSVLKGYRRAAIVTAVGKNTLRYPMTEIPAVIPNDPRYPEQWALEAIHASDAWKISTGAPDVIIAVIDSGVDYAHSDLTTNIFVNDAEFYGAPGIDDDANGFTDDIRGWDFAADGPLTLDRYGHGTQVAGVIAAAGNNRIGISGVSWQAKILPLKAMADNGTGNMDAAGIIAAIDYAIAVNSDIVNCSFGGTDENANPDGTTQDDTTNFEWEAFVRLRDAGILAVCAAGNSGADNDVTPCYPASYALDNIISVAATAREGILWPHSNFGADSVDLAAPGENILSTAPGPVQSNTEEEIKSGLSAETLCMTNMSDANSTDISPYASTSGTSLAVPHVSGAAALLYAVYPSINYRQVREALLASATPIPIGQDKIASGGMLNVYAAIRFEQPPAGDFTGDFKTGIDDVIVALQVLVNLKAPVYPGYHYFKNDIRGDGRIRLPDILYLLDNLARQPSP